MIAGLASFVLISAVLAPEPTHRFDKFEEGPTEDAEALSKTHLAAIKKEIEEFGDHPWAGTYYLGDGLGANLSITLAPRNGFSYQWAGCLGVYDRSNGSVIQTDRGTLTLNPTSARPRNFEKEFVPISWGHRRYLIPLKYVARFCNSVESGSEPRKEMHGTFYLREGDHEKPANGPLVFPQGFPQTCDGLSDLSSPIDALTSFLRSFERLNWNELRSFFAEDACVFHSSADFRGRICGKSDIELSYHRVFQEIRRSSPIPPSLNLRPQRLHTQKLGTDVAITTFELEQEGQFGRRTIMWQKQPSGEWKIIHLHASNMALGTEPPR